MDRYRHQPGAGASRVGGTPGGGMHDASKRRRDTEDDDEERRERESQRDQNTTSAPRRTAATSSQGKGGKQDKPFNAKGNRRVQRTKDDRDDHDDATAREGADTEARPYDIYDVVEANRRVTLRLCEDIRAIKRLTCFVVLIQPTAQELRALLLRARQEWQDRRPANGPHPDGAQPAALWAAFSSYFEGLVQQDAKWPRAKDTVQWLRATFPYADRPTDTTVYSFAPKQKVRSRAPDGIWVWHLSFNYIGGHGNASHQGLVELMRTRSTECDEFRIQQDIVPQDKLVKDLQSMRI
jgi:hypothetical protein